MNRIYVLVTLLVFVSGCQSLGPNAAGGGALGGFAGGLAGAAIGSTEGKAPEGALIGAVTGATVGGVAGNAVDRDIRQQQFAEQQFYNQQVAGAITVDQVARMTQSGLGSDVIARQITSQGIFQRPTIDDLILLKQNGVDDQIIQAMQTAPVIGQGIPGSYVHSAPVVVEQTPIFVQTRPRFHHPHRRYVQPRYYGPPRHARRRSPGVGFSFGF